MPDILTVRNNIKKLAMAGASPEDVDAYVKAEGFSPDQVAQAGSTPAAPSLSPGTVGAAQPADTTAPIPQIGSTGEEAFQDSVNGKPLLNQLGDAAKAVGNTIKESPFSTVGQGVAETAALAAAGLTAPETGGLAAAPAYLGTRAAVSTVLNPVAEYLDYLYNPKANQNPFASKGALAGSAARGAVGFGIGEGVSKVASPIARKIMGKTVATEVPKVAEKTLDALNPSSAEKIVQDASGLKDPLLLLAERSAPESPRGLKAAKTAIQQAQYAKSVGIEDTPLDQLHAKRQQALKTTLTGGQDMNLSDFAGSFGKQADQSISAFDKQADDTLASISKMQEQIPVKKTIFKDLGSSIANNPSLKTLALQQPGDAAALQGFANYLKTLALPESGPIRVKDLSTMIGMYKKVAQDNPILNGILWKDDKGFYTQFRDAIKTAGGAEGDKLLQAFDLAHAAGNTRLSDIYQATKTGNIEQLAGAFKSKDSLRQNLVALNAVYPGKGEELGQQLVKNLVYRMADQGAGVTGRGMTDALATVPVNVLRDFVGPDYLNQVRAVKTLADSFDRTQLQNQLKNLPATPGVGKAVEEQLRASTLQPLAAGTSRIGVIKGAMTRITNNSGKTELQRAIYGPNRTPRAVTAGGAAGDAAARTAVGTTTELLSDPMNTQEAPPGDDLQRMIDSFGSSQEGQTGVSRDIPSLNGTVQQFNSPNNDSVQPDSKADPIGFLIRQLETQDGSSSSSKLPSSIEDSSDPLGELIKQSTKDAMPGTVTKIGDASATAAEEGKRLKVYKDKFGNKTVGIGFNMDSPGAKVLWGKAGLPESLFDQVRDGKKSLTDEQTQTLFGTSTKDAEEKASSYTPGFDKLGVYQQAALADLLFQVGETNYKKFRNMLDAVKRGDTKAAAAFMKNSLVNKQTPERNLRRVYMLEHNTDHQTAQNKLIEAGLIDAKHAVS